MTTTFFGSHTFAPSRSSRGCGPRGPLESWTIARSTLQVTISPGVTVGLPAARAINFWARVRAMSEPEIGALQIGIAQERRGRPLEHDAAVLQHIRTMRDLERLADILLDEQDGQAFLVQPADQGEQLLDRDGRQSQRGLVEDEESRLRPSGAPAREALL